MRHWQSAFGAAALLFATSAGCGAKTGLLVPDASQEPDAGMDAGVDAGMCMPRPISLTRRGAQILFVIDRSNSMADTLDGRVPRAGELSRWELLAETLADVLADADPQMELGAKFFPRRSANSGSLEHACSVDPGIELVPRRSNTHALLELFRTTEPSGGTPTALGLAEARTYFRTRPETPLPRYIVFATDGGPNCNLGLPRHPMCVCTGEPESCAPDSPLGVANCLDDTRTIDLIRELSEEFEIPVYVIGMDDPNRPELAEVLDRMAIAGGRPREVPGEPAFYSVRRPNDLRGALTTITESVSRCVFTVSPVPDLSDEVELQIGDVFIPRDPTRVEGWDFTTASRSELTLFGGACERATRTEEPITATIACTPAD